MAEIYKNIKTGVKAELVEINEKSKQVTLKKLADGKPTSTLMGSFEKYWKKIDGDATSEKKPAKTEPKKEAEKPVEEPAKAEEVKKEEPKAEKPKNEKIAKAEKPKKEKKAKKERVKNTENVTKITDAIFKYIEKKSGCDVGVPREESMKFRALRINGRQFCKLMWSDKSVRLYFRCDDVKKVSDKVEVANYSLPNLYIVTEFNEDEVSNIKQMFDISIDYEIKRKEKAEKSEKKETKNSKKVEAEEK